MLEDLLLHRATCNVTGTLSNEWSDCADAWGGIERHVTLYDTATNTLDDHFFSLAHDRKMSTTASRFARVQTIVLNKASTLSAATRPVPFQLFENRTAFGARIHVPQAGVGGSTPSRLAYNVYKQGRWVVHITEPGSLAVAVELEHLLLWDMRDLDGDGKVEWVLSPTEAYLPKFRTQVARWDEGTRALVRTTACKRETSLAALRFHPETVCFRSRCRS